MRDWLVAADDRTGAFEVAALFAEVAGPTLVTVDEPAAGSCVVDIATRLVPRDDAIDRVARMESTPSRWSAHKIDSTLRGNWAAELVARQAVGGRRIVVLPAWPEMGRTCVGGVVHVHGTAIGAVGDHLTGAVGVAGADELRSWLGGGDGIAVCDLADEGDVLSVAAVVAGSDVLVAGPAGPLGAVFAARSGAWPKAVAPVVTGPVLVVCGSASPESREQLATLAAARPDVAVLASAATHGELDVRVVAELAEVARQRAIELQAGTIVLMGGDTAAAYLGDGSSLVGGFAAPGMPFSRDAGGGGPLVITKAGGFGAPDALVRLLQSS